MMIGVDLIEIDRVERALARYPGFKDRCFTKAEQAYCDSRANPAQHYAARFAAKEAAKKALDLEGVGWRDLEVARSPSGACHLVLHGAARVAAGTMSFALSMSHEGDHATAVVIAHD